MQAIPLFTLLGEYRFEVGLTCLKSFVANCRDAYQLIVLEDGTMSAAREAQLRQALPGMRLVRRKELEERVAPFLKNHPKSASYMNEHVLALKLLVPQAMVGELGGDFAYVDTDVLFFRPFRGLDRRNVQQEQMVYMHEERDSYSLGFKTRYFGADRIRLPAGSNSGMLFVRQGVFDLDFVEWFLSRDSYRAYPGVVEQTAWAAMAARVRAYRWSPRQISIPNEASDVTPQLIAQHLVNERKGLAESRTYIELVESVVAPRKDEVPTLQTLPGLFPGVLRTVSTRGLRQLAGKQEPVLATAKNPSELLVPALRAAWGGSADERSNGAESRPEGSRSRAGV